MIFQRKKRIRFHHCDPAGIVFYPQYLVLCNELVEDWFGDALGLNFFELHSSHARGIPMRHLEAEFMAPSTHGEELEFSLAVERIGRSSLVVRIRADKAGKPCFACRQTMVWAAIETGVPKAVAIDTVWRDRFARFLEPAAESA